MVPLLVVKFTAGEVVQFAAALVFCFTAVNVIVAGVVVPALFLANTCDVEVKLTVFAAAPGAPALALLML